MFSIMARMLLESSTDIPEESSGDLLDLDEIAASLRAECA